MYYQSSVYKTCVCLKSDTFTDGEKPESPAPHIVEKLSRDGSPAPADGEAETKPTSPPVADSPREDEHIEEGFDVEALEEDIMSPEQDREALVEMYQVRAISLGNYLFLC